MQHQDFNLKFKLIFYQMGGSCLKEKKHIKCGHFLKREGILMVAGMAKIPLLVGTFAFYMERLPWIKLFFGLKFFPNLQVFSLKLIVPKRYPLMPQFPRCKNGKVLSDKLISYYKSCHPTLASTHTKYNYKMTKASILHNLCWEVSPESPCLIFHCKIYPPW